MTLEMKKRFLKVLKEILFILLIGTVYYILNRLTGISIPCIFKEITGFYCAGCGVTRMCIAILKFDFYTAFRSNMFVFSLLPFIFIYSAVDIVKYVKTGKTIQSKIINIIILIVAILSIIFWILRNISTFSFLQPQ